MREKQTAREREREKDRDRQNPSSFQKKWLKGGVPERRTISLRVARSRRWIISTFCSHTCTGMCVCECVCVRERGRVCVCVRERVCVCERERRGKD